MKLSGYGRREWLGLGVIALALIAVCALIGFFGNKATGVYLGLLVLASWTIMAAFFRDPERTIPKDADALCSPADGVIRDIELIRGDGEEFRDHFQGRDMLRVGIFLSVFDVHINRAPCEMKVAFKSYKPGAFHDARDAKASKENESMALGGTGTAGDMSFPLVVRQISGAIARRIVCATEPGATLAKGERYGMIKFGSRTELFLPAGTDFELEVKVGDRVFAGSTVIARVVKGDEEPEDFTDTGKFPLQ